MRIGGFQKTSLIDYPGEVASIVFTQGCNFRCPYCHNPELVLPEYFAQILDEEKIISLLDKRRGKVPAVVITGGEPTLQPDLVAFMCRLKKLGLKIKLDTNGSDPTIIKQIIQEGLVDYIAMDIKGPMDKYTKIISRQVDTAKIKESIHTIIASKIDCEFRTTITKALLISSDFLKIREEIKGAKLYVLQNFRPTKSVNKNNFPPCTDSELSDFCSCFIGYVKKVLIR